MDLIARFEELLGERGWSKYRLAKEAGLSQSTLRSSMERGDNPTVATLERCCNAFGITLAEFFDSGLQEKELTLEERKLVNDWRKLTPEMQNAVSVTITASLATQEAKEN